MSLSCLAHSLLNGHARGMSQLWMQTPGNNVFSAYRFQSWHWDSCEAGCTSRVNTLLAPAEASHCLTPRRSLVLAFPTAVLQHDSCMLSIPKAMQTVMTVTTCPVGRGALAQSPGTAYLAGVLQPYQWDSSIGVTITLSYSHRPIPAALINEELLEHELFLLSALWSQQRFV